MRHAALGVFEGVLIGTALVAAAVLSARLLQEAHTPARERGDVLAELAIHGIAGPELASFCPAGV